MDNLYFLIWIMHGFMQEMNMACLVWIIVENVATRKNGC